MGMSFPYNNPVGLTYWALVGNTTMKIYPEKITDNNNMVDMIIIPPLYLDTLLLLAFLKTVYLPICKRGLPIMPLLSLFL